MFFPAGAPRSSLDNLYYDTHYSIPRGYLRDSAREYIFLNPADQYHHRDDPNFWALQNVDHPDATTRRAMAPLINLAYSYPDWFQDTLRDSNAMREHIVPRHAPVAAPSDLQQFLNAMRGGAPPQPADDPSRFYTPHAHGIAGLGQQAVLEGTPYLGQPGYGRGEHPVIGRPGQRSVLDFVHTFPNAIGIHEDNPTPRARFSFELGPEFSHLWDARQTVQAFQGDNPQIRLMTGHPISPPRVVPEVDIGRPAGYPPPPWERR